MATASDGGRRLELHVRSLSTQPGHGPQADVVARLHSLTAEGHIESVDIDIWGTELALEPPVLETGPARRILDRVEAFESWADRNGASVDRFFTVSDTTSEYTGKDYRRLTLPVQLLAGYRGDRLVHVAPHVCDGEVCTVTDRITALERTVRGRGDVVDSVLS